MNDDQAPEECTWCGASGVELERVDLEILGSPDLVRRNYGLDALQWLCPYCCVIPIQRREAMEPHFVLAAMMNELERRLRAGTKEGGE